MAINSIKTLTLSLDGDQVECQLTTAQLVDEPEGSETLTTFCASEDVAGTPKYSLSLAGYQDYGSAESVMDMLHTAYVANPTAEIDCVLEVGTKSRTFSAKPQADVPFGADSGAAFTAEVTLAVTSPVVDGTVTP
jgi:hypothetical protein